MAASVVGEVVEHACDKSGPMSLSDTLASFKQDDLNEGRLSNAESANPAVNAQAHPPAARQGHRMCRRHIVEVTDLVIPINSRFMGHPETTHLDVKRAS